MQAEGDVLMVSGENINPKNTGPGFGKSVEMLLAEAEDIKARKKAEIEAKKEVRGELSAGIEKTVI